MAIKKSTLYNRIWDCCDKLRGGMDASEYKNYVLTLLFVKYVTDKFKGKGKYVDVIVPEGGSFDDLKKLKGKSSISNKDGIAISIKEGQSISIGEGIDKVIAKLAEANPSLKDTIEKVNFSDEQKLGKGKDMVDKLTGLIAIFEDPALDFKNNRASDDDIIGDAYEYLMKNFATESGKSKGQFYTPAEVSRVMAKVIGIDKAKSSSESLYDPACGSGSLLIRAADEANVEITIYGQEKDNTTVGLAKMNLVLHNKASGEIVCDNTLAKPAFTPNDSTLKQFNYVVSNPPFSLKNWMDGVDLTSYGRFTDYTTPPDKNGDYAWLLHVIKSMHSTKGKGAIILPHGVLFRGNAEAEIRKQLVKSGIIKGIIGLPSNLFYGTGIPACIIVLDKENARTRKHIFMIDASRDFIKDGNKNRLRERDIYKIVNVFNSEEVIEHYSARVEIATIEKDHDFNLNIPRYIANGEKEDIQSIDGHLHGGIPNDDIDGMHHYFDILTSLKSKLFTKMRKGFSRLAISKDDARDEIYRDEEFKVYADKIDNAFEEWQSYARTLLLSLTKETEPKKLIVTVAQKMLEVFECVELVDKYDAYEVLLSYWTEIMQDDVYMISIDGFMDAKEIEYFYSETKSKNGESKKESKPKVVGWDGKIIPKTIIEAVYFAEDRKTIDQLAEQLTVAENNLNDLTEEHSGEEGYFAGYLGDDQKLDKAKIIARYKELKKTGPQNEEFDVFASYVSFVEDISKFNKAMKDLEKELDGKLITKYADLTEQETKHLVLDKKWFASIYKGIDELYTAISHRIANRVVELAERYEFTLSECESKVDAYEAKVKLHLAKMGYAL